MYKYVIKYASENFIICLLLVSPAFFRRLLFWLSHDLLWALGRIYQKQ